MSQTTVDCAQGPVERLGEGDVARVKGSDVCSQLEGPAHQPKRGVSHVIARNHYCERGKPDYGVGD